MLYRWDFGDGSTGTGRKIRHTYVRAGTYTVRLITVDDAGASATRTHSMIVSS